MFRNSFKINVVLNLKETNTATGRTICILNAHMRDFDSDGEGKRLDVRMSQVAAITDPGK